MTGARGWCSSVGVLAGVLGLAACTRPAPPAVTAHPDAATVDVPGHPPAPGVTVGRGAQGPWRATGTAGAAPSPAVRLTDGVYSALAYPEESLARAEIRWVRWDAQGATVMDRRQTSGMAPGSAMALVARTGGGHTVVWQGPAQDGGEGACRALDVGPTGFLGDERPAGVAEAPGAQWLAEVMARRPRQRADEPAPVPPSQAALVSVEVRRSVGVVTSGGVEITRGDDLPGYERAVTAVQGTSPGDRWVALSRGRCTDARVEVYRVVGGTASLQGSFPIGAELGVRWLALDPRGNDVAVSWYQDLIPLRMECARGAHAPAVTEHGIRVALITGG